jgi:hypothetical protein
MEVPPTEPWRWASANVRTFVNECRMINECICSARDWDDKDYLRIIPRVVW